MNILHRLKKLESDNPNNPACFCHRTLLDLWYGKPGADALTYCPRCKDKFDYWQKLGFDAETSENLTD